VGSRRRTSPLATPGLEVAAAWRRSRDSVEPVRCRGLVAAVASAGGGEPVRGMGGPGEVEHLVVMSSP